MTEPTGQDGEPSWLRLALADGTPRKACGVALVVGLILNAINQGDALVSGAGLDWLKVALNFLVPYAVATYGAVMAKRALAKGRR